MAEGICQAQRFMEKTTQFFENTKQTGWGKNQITKQILNLWANFLLEELEKKEKQNG